MGWLSRNKNLVLALLVVVAGGFAWAQWQMMQLAAAGDGDPCRLVSEDAVAEVEFGDADAGYFAVETGATLPQCEGFLTAFRCIAEGPTIVRTVGDAPVHYDIPRQSNAVIAGRGTATFCTVEETGG